MEKDRGGSDQPQQVTTDTLFVQKTDVFLTLKSGNERPVFLRVSAGDFERVFLTPSF